MDRPRRRVPDLCPNGHRLTAGHVLHGWKPCQCPEALARNRGHFTTTCLDCRPWTVVAYDPPHIRSAEEAEKDLQWVRAALAMAEEGGAPEREVERYQRALSEGERTVEALRERRP